MEFRESEVDSFAIRNGEPPEAGDAVGAPLLDDVLGTIHYRAVLSYKVFSAPWFDYSSIHKCIIKEPNISLDD